MMDLKTAHEEWLVEFENSSLSLALRKMQERLVQALQASDLPKAWATIASMCELSQRLQDQRQTAETLLVAGRAAFELGDYQQAAKFLQDSAAQYDGDQHAHGVAKWMLGYVLWHLPDQHADAIAAWQTSLNDFARLMHQPYHSGNDWYPERIAEMQKALDLSLDADALSLPPQPPAAAQPGGQPADAFQPQAGAAQPAQDGQAPQAVQAEAAPAPLTLDPAQENLAPAAEAAPPQAEPPAAPVRPQSRSRRVQPSHLGGFPVIDAVALDPAFQPVGVDAHVDEEMTIEQVSIQEHAYGVFNPYGPGLALRLGNQDLKVVRVYGKSMNLAGIEEGDYALVHRQNDARNGDIVVAQRVEESGESKATVKRFKRVSPDLVQLLSESTENYEPLDFSPQDPKITILGKVLAVFKKQSA